MFWTGAIVSLCYIPGVTGAFIATQWPVLAVLLSFWLVMRNGPISAYHLLGLLFLAYASLGIWNSPVPYFSVYGFWLACISGLSLWFGTTLTLFDVRRVYAGLALGASISSAIAVFQYFGFHPLPTMSPLPAGLYVNSVQQGIVLALIAVALVSERMWFWALPLLPGIALSGSRGAWLALVVGLIGCYARSLWVLAGAGLGGLYILLPLSISDQLRMQIWGAVWNSLTFFGHGPGVLYSLLLASPVVENGMFYPEYAHNDAFQLLFEYGIGALPIFAIFAFVLCRTQAREWPIILTFVTAGCYSFPLYMPVCAFLALMAVGRVLRCYAVVLNCGSHGGQHVILR